MKTIVELQTRYRAMLSRTLNRTFRVWERLGLHITPNHFYQPIPDTRTLDHGFWSTLSEIPGVDMKEESQLELLENFERNFKREYDGFRENKSAEVQGFFLNNKGFLRVDAEILYSFVRYFKPKRIVEIGSGFSTYVTAQAVEMNKGEDVGYECDFTAIEPYPRNFMKRGIPGLSRLVESKIQDVPWMEFTKLQKGDILFIDSTHVLKIGSDVQYEYLEIIPRLNPGVIIHVHDIFLPQDYPREWVMYKHWFFTEQYLLQAFLAFNSSFEVLWGSNYMHINHPEALKKAFRSYEAVSHPPSSLWMKRTK